MKNLARLLVVGLSLAAGPSLAADAPARARPEVQKNLLGLTRGREARVVWIRETLDVDDFGLTNSREASSTPCIMAFDTASGNERVLVRRAKGERILNPFFTPDGSQVVYSDVKDKTAHIVGFDGSGHRQLAFKRPGFNFVLGFSRDKETGEEYIYVGDNFAMTDTAFAAAQQKVAGWSAGWGDGPVTVRQEHASAVYRYKFKALDSEPELVWDKMPAGYRSVITPDGKYLVGELPWPRLAFAALPSGELKEYALGFSPFMTPFNTLGSVGGEYQHKTAPPSLQYIWMHATWNWKNHSRIKANTMQGLIGKRDIWRPKLAFNDGYFLVIRGCQDDAAGGNVYFGAFNGTCEHVGGWVEISDSKVQDAVVRIEDDSSDLGPAPDAGAAIVNKEPAAWVALPKEQPAVKADPVAAAPSGPPPPWPTHQDGLLFKWSSGNAEADPPLALNDSGKPIAAFGLTAKGRAMLGPSYEMLPAGGSFEAVGVGPLLAQSWKSARALGIEAFITPQDMDRDEAGEILSFGSLDGRYAVLLVQQRDKLLLGLLTSSVTAVDPKSLTEIATLPAVDTLQPKYRAVHLFVGHAGGVLTCYLDGKPVDKRTVAGNYSTWPEDLHVIFGNSATGGRDWRGRLEKVAFYQRVLPPEEVAANAAAVAAIAAARPPIDRLVIKATLLRRSAAKADIQPQIRALGRYEYRVDNVISGTCKTPQIDVMHWTVMDGKPLPIASRVVEEACTLVLEPFDKHPELRAALQQNDLGEDVASAPYYDVDTR